MDSVYDLKDHVKVTLNWQTGDIDIRIDEEANKFIESTGNAYTGRTWHLESIANELLLLILAEMKRGERK